MTKPNDLLLMAEILGAHGIRGMLKVKAYGDDPLALVDYPPLCDIKGEKFFTIETIAQHGNTWLAEFEGVTDRTAAEKLRGIKLYLSRAALPEIKNEGTYYHADLIGLTALRRDGSTLGAVIAVDNFGAGDLLHIKPPKGNSFYLPFTGAVVPEVDLEKKTLIAEPPPGLLD